MEIKQIQATKENVDKAINEIKKYSSEKGYQIIGETAKGDLRFDSKKKEKVLRKYLWMVENKMGMSSANRFLHFLYKKVYKLDKAPRIEYSEKELKIKESRRAWKKVQQEADKLLAAYKEEKGSFYKK